MVVVLEQPRQLPPALFHHQRHYAEQRHIEQTLDGVVGLERVAQGIEEEGEGDADDRCDQRDNCENQVLARFARFQRCDRRVDDARLGRIHVRGGGGFLEAGDEGFVEGSGAVDFTLEFAQLEFLARNVLNLRLVAVEGFAQGVFAGHCQLILALDTGNHLLHLQAQAVGRRKLFGSRGDQRRVLRPVAARQLFDFGLGLGQIGLELLNQRIAQHCRHAGQTTDVAVAQGLRLTELALRFGTIAARIDHAVAGHLQLVGTDGGDAVDIDQTLFFAIGLQLVFGDAQVVAQLDQAGVHPTGVVLRRLQAGVLLAVDKALGEGVGHRRSERGVRQFDFDFQQLTFADKLDAGMQHQVLRDVVEHLFFGRWRLRRRQQIQPWQPLVTIEVRQPLARGEPTLRLLAWIGDRVGSQAKFAHGALGQLPRLQQGLLSLQVISGGGAAGFGGLLKTQHRRRLVLDQQCRTADVLRRDERQRRHGQRATEQHQPGDVPLRRPDHPPQVQQIKGVRLIGGLRWQVALERTFEVGAWAVVHDQKKPCAMEMVSPGAMTVVREMFSVTGGPPLPRKIVTRFIEARSVRPPPRAMAFSRVSPGWKG